MSASFNPFHDIGSGGILNRARVFFNTPDDNGGQGGGTATAGGTPPASNFTREARGAADDLAAGQDDVNAFRAMVQRMNTVLDQLEQARATDDVDSRLTALENERRELEERRDALADTVTRRFMGGGSMSDVDDLKDTDGRWKGGQSPIMQCVRGAYLGWAGGEKAWPVLPMVKAFHERSGLPLDTSTAQQLALMVPPQLMADFIERLSAKTVALALGARLVPLDGAPARWNKNIGGASAGWVGEGMPATKSTVDTEFMQLFPKELAAATDIQRRLLMLAPGSSDMAEEDLERALSEKLDMGIIRGSGGSAVPLGIMNVTGTGQTPMTGGSAYFGAINRGGTQGTLQNVTQYLDLMVSKVDQRNAYNANGRMAWACAPLALMWLRQTQNDNGDLILQEAKGGMQWDNAQAVRPNNGRGELWGHPVATSSLLTYGTSGTDLVFGDWSQIIVGSWGPLIVESSRDNKDNFERGVVTIRMEQLVDAGVRHPEAFEIASAWTNVTDITV